MKKCPICNGHKYILGMGSMREKCKYCGGKGFIEPVSESLSFSNIDLVKKNNLENEKKLNKLIEKKKSRNKNKVKKGNLDE